MRKIILHQYGSVNVLQEIDESVPVPDASQILVKLTAASINDPDIVMRQNGPFPTMPPEFRPTLPHMIGHDFSGIVTAIGNDVTACADGFCPSIADSKCPSAADNTVHIVA